MPPVGFEPTISGGERRQTYALDARPPGPGRKGNIAKLTTAGDRGNMLKYYSLKENQFYHHK